LFQTLCTNKRYF